MNTFALRFDHALIPYWATQFNSEEDATVENEIVPQLRSRGYLTKEELLSLCRWKSPRARKYVEDNDEDFIKVVTQVALSTPNEQLRIQILTLLHGVNWPTASVILHFCHTESYPILDFRTLWSLGAAVPEQYDFNFWQAYTQHCRALAAQAGVSIRTLDRALWQYAKHHQGGWKEEIAKAA
jgi:hypothetical protein